MKTIQFFLFLLNKTRKKLDKSHEWLSKLNSPHVCCDLKQYAQPDWGGEDRRWREDRDRGSSRWRPSWDACAHGRELHPTEPDGKSPSSPKGCCSLRQGEARGGPTHRRGSSWTRLDPCVRASRGFCASWTCCALNAGQVGRVINIRSAAFSGAVSRCSCPHPGDLFDSWGKDVTGSLEPRQEEFFSL